MKELSNKYGIVALISGVFPLILITFFYGLLFNWIDLFLIIFPIIAITSGGLGIKDGDSPTMAKTAIILGIILIIVILSFNILIGSL